MSFQRSKTYFEQLQKEQDWGDNIPWTKKSNKGCKGGGNHDVYLAFEKLLWRLKCDKCGKNMSGVITTGFALVLKNDYHIKAETICQVGSSASILPAFERPSSSASIP